MSILNHNEQQYVALLETFFENDPSMKISHDRTGTGTFRKFGQHLELDLAKGFPVLTKKYIHFKSVVAELLWFLRGDTNTAYLHQHGCHIWDEWADENGNLGHIYGKQWRDFGGVDQISELISGIKKDPFSRRHIVSAWNPAELNEMALAPCHCFFQNHIDQGVMHMNVYMRSCDIFLGLPFNMASYGLLLHLLSLECGYRVGKLFFSFGDLHLYSNHLSAARKYLDNQIYDRPTLGVVVRKSIFSYATCDFSLTNYSHAGKVPAPIAV